MLRVNKNRARARKRVSQLVKLFGEYNQKDEQFLRLRATGRVSMLMPKPLKVQS